MTKPKRRLRRWILGTAGVLVLVLLIAVAWVADALIRPQRLQNLINEVLLETTGGLYYVELGGISWGLGAMSVELRDVAILLNRDLLVERARAGTLPDLLFALEADRIDLLGVDLWGVLQGRGFHALALEIDQPTLRVGLGNWLARDPGEAPDEARIDPASPANMPAASAVAPAAAGASRSLPRLSIGRIELSNAALENYAIPDADAIRSAEDIRIVETLDDVDFLISGLDMDPNVAAAPRRVFFSDDITIDIGTYTYEWPDGIHSERHGPVHISTSEGVFAIENFSLSSLDRRQLTPDANGHLPRTRDVAIDELRLEGIDFARMMAEKRFDVSTFLMRGMHAQTFDDEELETDLDQRPDRQAASLADPVTMERPGSLIAAVFGKLPPLDVQDFTINDTTLEQIFDRRGGAFLEVPRVRRGVYGAAIAFRGFHSEPGIEFDPARPFLSDSVSIAFERITATPDPTYEIGIAGFTLDSAASGDIHLGGVSLRPLAPRSRRGNPVDAADAVSFTTGPLDLNDVDFGMLMDRLRLNMSSVALTDPEIEVISTRSSGKRAPAEADAEEVAETSTEPRATAIARGIDGVVRRLPRLQVGRFTIRGADVTSIHDATEDGWLDAPETPLRIVNVDLLIDGFNSDPEQGYDGRMPLVGRASSLAVESVDAVVAGRTYRLQLRDLALTEADTTLRIGEFSYRPLVGEDSDSRNARLATGSVVNVDAQGLAIEEVDRLALMARGEVRASRIALQDPTMDLYVAMAGEPVAADDVPDDHGEPDADEAGPTVAVDHLEIRGANYRRLGAMPDHDWSTEATLLDAFLDVDLLVRDVRLNEPASDQMLSLQSLILTAAELRVTPGEGPDRVRINDVRLDTTAGSLHAGLLRFGPPTLAARFAGEASGFDLSTGKLALTDVPMLDVLDAVQSNGETSWTDLVLASQTRLTIDDVRLELPSETPIAAGRVDVRVSGDVVIDDVAIEAETGITVPHLTVSGMRLRELFDSGAMTIDAVGVTSPRLRLPSRDAPVTSTAAVPAAARVGAQPGKPLRATIERAVDGLPQLRVGRISVTDLQATGLRRDGELAAQLDSSSLEIMNLDLTDAGRARRDRVLFSDHVRVHSPGYRWTAGNGDDMGIGPIDLDTATGSLSLGAFHMIPATSEEAYLQQTDVAAGDRVEFRIGSVGFDGIDWDALLDEGAIHIRAGHIADWQVRVLADKHKPKRPPRTTPPGFPHDIFRKLSLPIAVDRLEMLNGFVRYAERHAEGLVPGTIEFVDLHGAIDNLSNEPDRMSMATPAVLTVQGKINGEAELSLTWNLPLLEPGPTMSYTGHIGPFRASLLETILTPLEGVAFPKGEFQDIWFDISDDTERATGTFRAHYTGLKIRLQDRVTGKVSIKQRVINFVANLILPGSMQDKPGKPSKTGEVDWLIPPDAPFFKIFWVGIREGLLHLFL